MSKSPNPQLQLFEAWLTRIERKRQAVMTVIEALQTEPVSRGALDVAVRALRLLADSGGGHHTDSVPDPLEHTLGAPRRGDTDYIIAVPWWKKRDAIIDILKSQGGEAEIHALIEELKTNGCYIAKDPKRYVAAIKITITQNRKVFTIRGNQVMLHDVR